MFLPHIPTVEILQFLLRLRNNPPFLRIGRIFMLTLVALSAVGCASDWVTGFDLSSPACTVGRWDCYTGGPLRMTAFVHQLGASHVLLLIPLIALLSAFVLLLRPARTYLIVMLLSWAANLIGMAGSDARPYVYTLSGTGYWLWLIAMLFLCLLTIPLALVEQATRVPESQFIHWLQRLE